MNRTSLSVIALAVGAVLIIGLFNVYKPQTKALVNKVFSKVHVNHLGLKERHYDGLTYTDDHNGNIEFVRGKLSNDVTHKWGWVHGIFQDKGLPKDVQNAKTVKFDDGVDISHTDRLNNMFGFDDNLTSIDLGDNFSTGNVVGGGMMDMFSHDHNLEHVNVSNGFGKNTDPHKMWGLFHDTPKLKSLSGHPNQTVQFMFDHRDINNGDYPK